MTEMTQKTANPTFSNYFAERCWMVLAPLLLVPPPVVVESVMGSLSQQHQHDGQLVIPKNEYC